MPKKKKVNLTYLVNFSCKSFILDQVRFHQWVFFCFSKTTDSCTSAKLKALQWTIQRRNNCTCGLYLSIFLTCNILQKFKSKIKNFLSKDGKNKTVQQWLDVRGTKGVYSKTFPIPRDSNHGQWRIVVESLVI